MKFIYKKGQNSIINLDFVQNIKKEEGAEYYYIYFYFSDKEECRCWKFDTEKSRDRAWSDIIKKIDF